MTLLTICQQAARSAAITVPSTIVGNTDQTAILLYGLAQDEGEMLARRPQGGWTEMIVEYEFTTKVISGLTGSCTAGSAVVTGITPNTTGIQSGFVLTMNGLPNNAVVATIDSSSQVTLASPVTASATETNQSLTASQVNYPLPADFERIVDNTAWDRTRYWNMRGPLSPQQWQLYKSSSIGQASIQRRWRITQQSGVDYFSLNPTPTDNVSLLVFEYVSNSWCQSATGTRQTQWLADTDTGIIDEFLIRLGVKWRVLERLGLAYATALDDYERSVTKAMGQDGGAKTLSLTPSDSLILIGPMNLPESGFGGVTA